MKELVEIQSKLKAPKNQENKFGGFNYRSCEDILEAVKPLLKETGCVLNISDSVVSVGDRVYIQAVAKIINGEGLNVSSTAYAREPATKKGMDEMQVSGAASSYARKYALNGLFAIDDNKDSDTKAPADDKPAATAEEVAEIKRMLKEKGIAEASFLKTANCTKWSEFKQARVMGALNHLASMKDAA